MPQLNRTLSEDAAPPPVPANSDDAIEFDPALIRGVLRWQTATLGDGRVMFALTLDIPGQEPELRQILLHRTQAAQLGEDLRELATALHLVK